MALKRVALRCDLAAETASAATEWSLPAQEKLEELLLPYLRPDEAMPDAALLLELLGRLLADRGGRLLDSGDELRRTEQETRSLRWQRDVEVAGLREELKSARFFFDAACGRGAGKRRGLGRGLSWMQPSHLARVGRDIAAELTAMPLDPRSEAGTLPHPAGLAAALLARAARLELLLESLAPQRAASNLARGEKERSLESTEKIVRRSAAFLAELYKLCELPLLAEKVRPAFRRSARKTPEPEPPATRKLPVRVEDRRRAGGGTQRFPIAERLDAP